MSDVNYGSRTSDSKSARVQALLDLIGDEVPWFMQAAEQALDRFPADYRAERIEELVTNLVADIKKIDSELSVLYTKTPDFSQIAIRLFGISADERNQRKRDIYRAFLVDAIYSPCEQYEKQINFLNTLQSLKIDHLSILEALAAHPDPRAHPTGSPIKTLGKRLPNIPHDRLEGLLVQMGEMKLTESVNWQTTDTHGRAECLEEHIAPEGKRLLRYMGRKI